MSAKVVSRLVTAGMLMGAGLGGFFDGIVFHQLLQVHSMLSATVPRDSVVNLEVNMFWDGVFHLFCLVLTCSGIARLLRASSHPKSGKVVSCGMLVGWGLFNFIEGICNHFLLGIHHVVELQGLSAWDYSFVGSGLLMVAGGVLLLRRDAAWTAGNVSSPT